MKPAEAQNWWNKPKPKSDENLRNEWKLKNSTASFFHPFTFALIVSSVLSLYIFVIVSTLPAPFTLFHLCSGVSDTEPTEKIKEVWLINWGRVVFYYTLFNLWPVVAGRNADVWWRRELHSSWTRRARCLVCWGGSTCQNVWLPWKIESGHTLGSLRAHPERCTSNVVAFKPDFVGIANFKSNLIVLLSWDDFAIQLAWFSSSILMGCSDRAAANSWTPPPTSLGPVA